MSKLVTIAIPIYKRLEYLPSVLAIVAAQDYPNLELLVSDNGQNGTVVPDIVAKYYPKPFRFRQNPATVNISTHFNQLIENASGEYFVVLADDDEISANYVSDLVEVIEKHPEASVAMAIQETIDEAGNSLSRSKNTVPEVLSGPDFIRAAWGTHEYGFRSFSTYLARRDKLLDCGGYPNFYVGCADEDAMFVKLCLESSIAFSTRSVFRKRYSESSDGYSAPLEDLARGMRDYFEFLDTEPRLLKYAAAHPAEWKEAKVYLLGMGWKLYHLLWAGMYRNRLTRLQWFRAAFSLPFIPDYYRAVAQTFYSSVLGALLGVGKRYVPWAYEIYRTAKAKLS